MEGGAQQSSLRDPPGQGGVEQEGVPSERDGGEGPPEVRRSQPLFIHGSRWVGVCTPGLSHAGGGVQRSGGGHKTGVGVPGVAQPLSARSRPLPEQEPRASSLPSIPNPFPELCSPSNSPILSSPPVGQGPPREGASHVSRGAGGWRQGVLAPVGAGSPPPGVPDARAGRW